MTLAQFNSHYIGNTYMIRHRDGSMDAGWKLAYSNLLPGTWKRGVWVKYTEPVALVENWMPHGIDIREVPIRFIEIGR